MNGHPASARILEGATGGIISHERVVPVCYAISVNERVKFRPIWVKGIKETVLAIGADERAFIESAVEPDWAKLDT